MDDGIQKLFEHLLGSPESSDILHDKGQKEDKSTTNSDGRKDPHVENWVRIGRWELEILSNERHVYVGQRMVVRGWVQVMEGGHWRL